MNILIPVDTNDIDEAQIISLDDVQYWLHIEFGDGKIINSTFYKTQEEIEVWLDVVIVINNKEYVWPFMEKGMAILVAPMQRYIEDIMEAYIFKELHELTVE